ncbi:hypothetical protein VA249_45500 (plasmid) [Vibrio alfacsensis]|uniref:N-6 DNA methylase n=1 Tax=Vibrio alfacsensis TaxID=1074311 RepID=UPI001BF13EE3|nr:N-6 DNA methylase [Vibrio alfacsensis]BBM67904.1 hypothetical protein VA249_45500 [Vibrio alfacsensis]
MIDSEYRKAFNLIEQWRYRYGTDVAVKAFVSQWAYQHTGLYKPTEKMVYEKAFEEVAIPLSHILSNLMLKGVSDPLAVILSEFCHGDAKHQGYYPTPQEVGVLISQLLRPIEPELCHANIDSPKLRPLKIYEPCCGSAGIILEMLESLFNTNIELDKPLGHVELVVEDISETALQAFCIQLIHKIQYLSLVSGKAAELAMITVSHVDVLSRKEGLIAYNFVSGHRQVLVD